MFLSDGSGYQLKRFGVKATSKRQPHFEFGGVDLEDIRATVRIEAD
jgi:hypothetical protein